MPSKFGGRAETFGFRPICRRHGAALPCPHKVFLWGEGRVAPIIPFECRACGGRGMRFPNEPAKPPEATVIRCQDCDAEVMTWGELGARVATALHQRPRP